MLLLLPKEEWDPPPPPSHDLRCWRCNNVVLREGKRGRGEEGERIRKGVETDEMEGLKKRRGGGKSGERDMKIDR